MKKIHINGLLISVFIFISLLSMEAVAARADIIFAIDTTASMTTENRIFENSLNDLARNLAVQNIDYHFIVLSDNNICISAPVGSGSCVADENLPDYRHVDVGIGSSNSLTQIINSYLLWDDSLRSGAQKSIVVLTDDNSRLDANSFNDSLISLNPDFVGYDFYGFIDPSIGANYQDLAILTGNSNFDIKGNLQIDLANSLSENISISAVPEPATVWLFITGLIALLGSARIMPRVEKHNRGQSTFSTNIRGD
jgi:hypothetical protein